MHSPENVDLRQVHDLVIAGWTGSDVAALEKHIRELEAIGVKRPKTTPIFYRVAASLLTSAERIEVLGDQSSGEAECVVYSLGEGLFVGVGSDHTDRKAEAIGVSLSKQMCAKPVSSRLWPYDEVSGHWDRLILRSFATIGGGAMLGPSSVKARSSSLTLRRYACFTWKGRNALLKPARQICLMSASVSPSWVWQSHSSFETVVSVTSRLSVFTVTRRPSE